jgi:squalene-associated FAD-dependent desaturase
MSIAVIGAGYAGLAAAAELARAGLNPVVHEAAREVGGRARRLLLGEHVLDNGQHILSGAYEELLRLMELVGAAPGALLERLPLTLRILPDFRIACPRSGGRLGLALGLLRARGLSWRDRWGAAALLRGLARTGWRTPPDETVLALLGRHRQSRRAVERLWAPLCIAALNTRPELAAAEVFVNVLRDTLGEGGAHSDLLLPRTDLGSLFPLPAQRYVEDSGGEVRLGRTVRELVPHGARWRVDGEEFDAVVLATPPWATARLLAAQRGCAELAAALKQLRYEPIYTCYLQATEDYRLEEPMLGLSQGIVQWVFDRGLLGGPPRVFAAVVSAGGPHEQLSLGEFGARAAHELAAALPSAPPFSVLRTIAESRATLRCVPGIVRPGTATPAAGLVLAGDYTYGRYPSTLEGAVRSGVAAARALLTSSPR